MDFVSGVQCFQRSQASQQIHPGITRRPSAIGFVEEFVAIGFAFQAYGVQAHVLHVIQIRIQALGRPAQEHVGSPGRAAYQNVFTVHLEETAAAAGEFGSDFANTEIDDGAIGLVAARKRR